MKLSPAPRLSLLALCLALAPAAHAGGYIGIGAGSVNYGYDSEQCTTDTGMRCEIDSNSSGAKIYAGLNPTPDAFVELAFYDLGTMEGSIAGGLALVEEDASAVALSLGGLIGDNPTLKFMIKGGLFSSSLDATATGPAGTYSVSDSTTGVMLGGGLLVHLNDHVHLRAEYEHFVDGGDAESDIGLASASLAVAF